MVLVLFAVVAVVLAYARGTLCSALLRRVAAQRGDADSDFSAAPAGAVFFLGDLRKTVRLLDEGEAGSSEQWTLCDGVVQPLARLKIVWATYQIVSQSAWATGVAYPKPFAYVAEAFRVFELDFISFAPTKCLRLARFSFVEAMLFRTLAPSRRTRIGALLESL